MKARNSVWPMVRLHQVIVGMQPGFAQRPNLENIGVPQLRTNNISPQGTIDFTDLINVTVSPAELEKYAVRKGDVIFNNTNSIEWVGKTACFNDEGVYVLSNHMTRIRVNTTVLDPDFLARYLHYLWQIGWLGSRAKQWVNQAAIDQTMLAQFELPFPPLPEQRRIVAILRQADRLRQLRQEANIKSRILVAAIFNEMFGDPITNREGWEVRKLGDFAEIVSRLVNPTEEKYKTFMHVGSDNIEGVTGSLINLRPVGHVEAISSKFLFTQEDILYSKIRPVLRKVATPDFSGLCSADIYPLRRKENLVKKLFLAQLLRTDHFTQYAIRASGRAQIPKINREDLLEYQTILPDIEAQIVFERKAERIISIWQSADVVDKRINILFQSLLAQAFSGELTATWREEHEGLESIQAVEVLEQPVEKEEFPIAERAFAEALAWKADRAGVVSVLSDEQLQVFDLINSSKGYCTVETLKASSDLPLYVIRQGVHLLTQVGLIQAVQLPDHPIRNVVYVPAYRALDERDQARTPDLGLLQQELEKGMML